MCGGVRENPDPLPGLLQAAERLRSQPPQPRDGAASAARLIALTRARDLLDLEIAREADAFGASGQWEAEGSTSPQDWLRHTCRMSTPAACSAVTVGAQMATLTESTAAVDAGRIGFAHLDLLARTAAVVERDSGGLRSLDEHLLLQLAEAHSVGRFYYDCYHARHAEDPAGALQEHVDAVERRSLEFSKQGDSLVRVSGLLDTAGFATVRSSLEPLATRTGGDDRRSRSRRLADAWVEGSSHVLDQGTLPHRGSQRPHVQITATVETLRGAAGAPGGEMAFAGPVPAATVQRLACDSALIRVLLNAESAVIDVGRARRTAPPATLRALRIRDGGCVWPGCERSAAWTTAHHSEEWARHNGGTNAATMVLLCYRHHWLVHEGGWQIRTDRRGRDHRSAARRIRARAGPRRAAAACCPRRLWRGAFHTWRRGGLRAGSCARAGNNRRAKIANVSEVTVLVFGPLRERIGIPELSGHGATVAEVWAELAAEHHLGEVPPGVRAARNLEYCEWNQTVSSGDVIAFLPPVAGGSGVATEPPVKVNISSSPIDLAAAIDVGGDEDGAVAVFIGRVRNHSDGHAVSRIEYDVYPEMAELEMRRIALTLIERDGVSRVAITHRVGTLEVGDASVVIAVSGPHRAEALAACHDTIDMIKGSVPIWKREHRDDGAHWVDARQHGR